MDTLTIRPVIDADMPAIEALYTAAFPDEDLLPLVRSLLQATGAVASLVATQQTQIQGNILFTHGQVAGLRAALLGPLAVVPTRHGQGIGSRLVEAGLAALRQDGVALVCVLGDPAYYGRFGFAVERRVLPPYELPAAWRDAWQSRYLAVRAADVSGALDLPPQWLQPSLWSP
ncbi:MAG: N-acetyltransferase [Pseudomonadota bacterium]